MAIARPSRALSGPVLVGLGRSRARDARCPMRCCKLLADGLGVRAPGPAGRRARPTSRCRPSRLRRRVVSRLSERRRSRARSTRAPRRASGTCAASRPLTCLRLRAHDDAAARRTSCCPAGVARAGARAAARLHRGAGRGRPVRRRHLGRRRARAGRRRATPGVAAIDLRRMNALLELDETSRLAVFEPGLRGPEAEELLARARLHDRPFPAVVRVRDARRRRGGALERSVLGRATGASTSS